MKYVVEKLTSGGARLGHISELKSHLIELNTPLCLVYTRKGSIPHLTPEVVKLAELQDNLQNVTLPSVADLEGPLLKFNKNLTNFTGTQDVHGLTYMSVQDAAEKTKTGYNDVNGVSVFTKHGKIQFGVDRYMEFQQAAGCDWFQALCDSDTNKDSQPKRIRKSVDRSISMLDACLLKANQNPKLKQIEVFGTIEGAYDIKERVRSAKETAMRPVSGFVLDGFENYGIDADSYDLECIRPILIETFTCLPTEKPRVMHGSWRPDQIIQLVELGIDIFDSSYAYLVTERLSALVFQVQTNSKSDLEEKNIQSSKGSSSYEINLKDSSFKNDFGPLLVGCLCYTCRRHTRAYVHHLVNTSELLASVLLMIHNLSHYLLFFNKLRQAIRKDELVDFKRLVIG